MGAWQITKKDLRLLSKDRRTLILLLALPLVFVAILGASTGQLFLTHDESRLVQIGIVDDNHGQTAATLIRNLQNREGLKVGLAENGDEARLWLDDGRYNIVVTIGPEFQQRVDALELSDVLDPEHGRLAEGLNALDMQVESGSSFINAAGLLRQLVLADTLRTVVPEVARKNKLAARFIDRAAQRNQERKKDAPTPPETSSGASIVYQGLVPSYTVMFAFFLVNIMAYSFIGERNLGTLRRLRSAPITPFQLLAGKTIPFLVVSLVQSGLLFAAGKVMFGMSWGNSPWLLIPVIVSNSLAATSLGLLLATLVRSESQVSAYANFLVISTAGISGCFMPRDWLPELMQQVSLATPHAWALIAYDQILTRAHTDATQVARCCAMLLFYAGVYFAIGWWRFRRQDLGV